MSHSLEHLPEFEELLADYHVSDEAREVLQDVTMVATPGPSGSGRSSMIEGLLETGHYERIVSTTTRPPRENDGVMEQNGVHYWFVSEEEMLEKLRNGDMLEAELIHGIQVSGISMEELRKAREHGKVAITEMDFGIDRVHEANPNVIILFVAPHDHETHMQRFKGRGNMSEAEFEKRLGTVQKMYETALDHPYYKIIINEHLPETIQTARRIIEEGKYTEEEHESGLTVVRGLLDRITEMRNQ